MLQIPQLPSPAQRINSRIWLFFFFFFEKTSVGVRPGLRRRAGALPKDIFVHLKTLIRTDLSGFLCMTTDRNCKKLL